MWFCVRCTKTKQEIVNKGWAMMSVTIKKNVSIWALRMWSSETGAHCCTAILSKYTGILLCSKMSISDKVREKKGKTERKREERASALLSSFQSSLNSREKLAAGKWGAAFFHTYTSIYASLSALAYAHVHAHTLSHPYTQSLFSAMHTLFNLSPQRLAVLNSSSSLSHYITLQDTAPAHPYHKAALSDFVHWRHFKEKSLGGGMSSSKWFELSRWKEQRWSKSASRFLEFNP